jgi:hypothetical protein
LNVSRNTGTTNGLCVYLTKQSIAAFDRESTDRCVLVSSPAETAHEARIVGEVFERFDERFRQYLVGLGPHDRVDESFRVHDESTVIVTPSRRRLRQGY